MPKLINQFIGKLVACDRKDELKDFSYAFGCLGYVEFYESQNLHPGLVFARYYFNLEEPGNLDETTHYIFTACGDLKIDGNLYSICDTRPNGSTFIFEIKGEVDAYSVERAVGL